MAAHCPAPRSRSFSSPPESYTSAQTSAAPSWWRDVGGSLSLPAQEGGAFESSNSQIKKEARRDCSSYDGEKIWGLLAQGCRGASAHLGSGAPLRWRKHLEISQGLVDKQNTSDCERLRGSGKRAPCPGAPVNCRVRGGSCLLHRASFEHPPMPTAPKAGHICSLPIKRFFYLHSSLNYNYEYGKKKFLEAW